MSYHRINLDGESRTKTAPAGESGIYPGMVVYSTAGTFKKAASAVAAFGRLFVAHPQWSSGKGITDVLTSGDTMEGEYVEEGRELLMYCAATQTIAADEPVYVDAGAIKKVTNDATTDTIGYAVDGITSSTLGDLIRVRVRSFRKDAVT